MIKSFCQIQTSPLWKGVWRCPQNEKTGKRQQKDLTYQYRYQDISGKRRTVYAPALEEFRTKKAEINNTVNIGMDYNAGNVTVMERYISLKQGVRNTTKVG